MTQTRCYKSKTNQTIINCYNPTPNQRRDILMTADNNILLFHRSLLDQIKSELRCNIKQFNSHMPFVFGKKHV